MEIKTRGVAERRSDGRFRPAEANMRKMPELYSFQMRCVKTIQQAQKNEAVISVEVKILQFASQIHATWTSVHMKLLYLVFLY